MTSIYLCIDTLFGNLSRDLVGPDWMLDGSFPESEECSDECQGHADAEPEGQEGDQGEERDGGRGALVPENQVHDEEEGKNDSEMQKDFLKIKQNLLTISQLSTFLPLLLIL